jgi:hypothetical protein
VGIFCQKAQKNIKTLKNSMKPDRIEGFEHLKLYHTPPEYPGYDVKIPPQHGVSDPLKIISSTTMNCVLLIIVYPLIRSHAY